MTDQGAMIILVIVAFVFYFVGKNYATKLYQTTGYYAYGKLNLFLAGVTGILIGVPLFGAVNEVMAGGTVPIGEFLLFIGIILIPLAILVIRNLKLKNPVHIILMTIMQVLAGVIAIFGLLAMIALKMAGRELGGGNAFQTPQINNIAARDREMQQQAQQQYQQQQYQQGFDAGRESTPYDSMPGGMSREAQQGYEQGKGR